ncbi:tRNA (adenosine(37)-N6)-threonylcarbamoyltransferase complex ATPase subunit type 1 TsaE [Candidatus Saccharibacteria bacterium]|nr:tRNA (adenosine(37)-N6)-threonylcarbamoyltransferase complex ATPase subunit type 1 TsaE [Candidatus Saccharibacteria bacterium]MBP9489381.1 tRNA (adenosine(37)-N6)-threonylcarbamoyltransferase complex ATPase subunit type 1 TsaE [Candidatus Saccharibacteria bacterium]MBP9552403.1 tRNA (adenosine(37)-N6)-threonylcarbamoyltransferase complex ATPase subunit type 1 TsaE [Candidatus Saccharibacteria bacterium]
MIKLGYEIGASLLGGEVLELVGDVGAGKTTFTKGLAKGIGVLETVQSPSFTISRVYEGEKLQLKHYDFYRLAEPGILAAEISESLAEPDNITVVEWAESVSDILPEDRTRIVFQPTSENSRKVEIYNLKGDLL